MTRKPASIEEQWPASKVELWAIDRIKPYENNPKIHPQAQVDLIAQSMREDGVTAPILVDEAGLIIYGHGRRLAAIQNGYRRYPVVQALGWTEEQKRAARIKDNSYAALSPWNFELMKVEVTELRDAGYSLPLLGFGEPQLRAFGVSIGTEGQADPENAPAAPAAPISRPGDCWVLGNHRLLCGDSTVPEDVDRALGGAKPHLMVTDQPYGVDYNAEWRNERMPDTNPGKTGGSRHKVANDHVSDWSAAWMLFKGDVAYVWHGDLSASAVEAALADSGFKVRSQIIWTKHQSVIGRGHYHFQHEACWYAVREGATAHWNGDRKQTTVWPIAKPQTSETGHSTQKPIDCMKRPIENNSKAGDSVYEPFCGSGTTIIACEMTDRHCRAIELDHAYVDVAVLRWQTFTGKEAVLDGSGKTFAQVQAESAKKKGATRRPRPKQTAKPAQAAR